MHVYSARIWIDEWMCHVQNWTNLFWEYKTAQKSYLIIPFTSCMMPEFILGQHINEVEKKLQHQQSSISFTWTILLLPETFSKILLSLAIKRPVCRSLGVPPGRGSCPLTGPLPFDLIYTDYHGLQQMKQHMGLSLRKHRSVAFEASSVLANVPLFSTAVHECHLESPLSWNTSVSAYWLAAITGFLGLFIYLFVLFPSSCVSIILRLGQIQFGLFSLWSIKQVLFKCRKAGFVFCL